MRCAERLRLTRDYIRLLAKWDSLVKLALKEPSNAGYLNALAKSEAAREECDRAEAVLIAHRRAHHC